ncbi:MAG TPA: UDP-N-acetylmuramoyl-L-alanine--D-glutamate ligase, partial [Paenisporosarcina sp.]|nr:UDP-N-acetylmuramoyl-L-alanine--D-glutamate ligase [Paenisporosarcina sp.]
MGIDEFHPRIAILTNLYEAHLDYHGSFKEYGDAKFGVTKNQTNEDVFIYNADQPEVVKYASLTNAKLIPFSTKGRREEGISGDAEYIYWNGELYLERRLIALPGEHNLENILCAVATAILMDCPKETIQHVLTSFTGVKHRTQFLREWKKRKFYNDSKATNTLATKSALAAFEQPVILLAGGLERGHSFEELREGMNHVKAVVAFGQTSDRLLDFAASCGVKNIKKVENIHQAVKVATDLSELEDVILLSPACASWDQYANFELRGDDFIEAVFQIK